MVLYFCSVKFLQKSINSIKQNFVRKFFIIAYTAVFVKPKQTSTEGYIIAQGQWTRDGNIWRFSFIRTWGNTMYIGWWFPVWDEILACKHEKGNAYCPFTVNATTAACYYFLDSLIRCTHHCWWHFAWQQASGHDKTTCGDNKDALKYLNKFSWVTASTLAGHLNCPKFL